VEADNGVAQATVTPPVQVRSTAPVGFVRFYREHFRTLLKTAMYAGATREQAEEATQKAMHEVLRRWDDIGDQAAYGCRAVISNFIKAKTHGLDRIRVRQVERGAGTALGRDDAALTMWEDREWVIFLLNSLPTEQRKVMAFVVDGFSPSEIAVMLGRSPEAVRQSLLEARKRLKQAIKDEGAAEQDASSMRKEAR